MSEVYKKLFDLPYGHFSTIPPAKNLHLHTLLLDCGRGRTATSRYRYDGLKRTKGTYSTFQLTIAGHGSLDYEDSHYSVRVGELMVLNIPHRHVYYFSDETPWDFVYLTFAGKEVSRLISCLIELNRPVLKLGLEEQQMLYKIFLRVLNKTANEFSLSADIYHLLMQIIEKYYYSRISSPIPIALRNIIIFLEQNYQSINLNVELMASIAGVGRSQLFRLFSKYLEQTPNKYLEGVRLNNAKKIINENNFTLERVAEECGFSSSAYLGKVFKKKFGLSPQKYKQRNLKS